MLLSCGNISSVAFLGHEFKKLCQHNLNPIINRIRCSSSSSSTTTLNDSSENVESRIGRIREMFKKVEISASAYDTAWVAMVPRDKLSERPCFPECLEWIMENQNKDGSWGLLQYPGPGHPLPLLSSTLACILALGKWKVGEQVIQKGVDYIEANCWAVVNDKHHHHQLLSPIGFHIVFPTMMDYATQFDLNLPFNTHLKANMLRHRDDEEIKRLCEKDLAYFGEGVDVRDSKFWRWVHNTNQTLLINSPATTAAAMIHQYHLNYFHYLSSALDNNKNNWVPTLYPMSVYIRLCMVDTLQRLGVSRYFKDEITDVLHQTYRLWEQKHAEIFSDAECCAMAFRLLRMIAYVVSSDELAKYAEEEYLAAPTTSSKGVVATLELYKASQLSIHLKEDVLQKIHAWTSSSLNKQMLNPTISDKQLFEEVEFALKNSCHGILERLESRRTMELYDVNKVRLLKTSYRCPNIDNRDFLLCSQQDYNICQALHQKELQQLERYMVQGVQIDELELSKHYLYSSYFLVAAPLFEPQLFDARIAWTQILIIITLVDDLLDNRGSTQEILNFMELVKVWDGHSSIGYCSKDVKMCFTAIHSTIDDLANKARVYQGRCVRHQLISLIQEMFDSMIMELEWWSKDVIPSMDEYLCVACVSVGCKTTLLTTIYFLGEKIPEDVVNSDELYSLCSHAMSVARLLNDVQTFKKERAERKVNSVSIQVVCSITEEEALTNIREMIEINRRQLLKMVLVDESEGSLVPKICKDLFWIMSKVSHYLYSTTDEYHSPKNIMNDINAVMYDPVKH